MRVEEKRASDILSRWYQPATMYVSTFLPAFDEVGKISGGIGRYIANPALHGAFNEPLYMDKVKHLDDVTTMTTLTITADHMIGHPWAFPGHKSTRAMEHAVNSNLSRNPQASSLRLTGYEAVSYKKRINCGDTIQVVSKITSVDRQNAVTADAEVLLNGEVAAVMRNARLTSLLQKPDNDTILLDQLEEGSAQLAGLLAMEGTDLEGLDDPLFLDTGALSFSRLPKTGETVLYYASKLSRRFSRFMTDMRIMIEEAHQEIEIGRISRVRGVMASKGEAA